MAIRQTFKYVKALPGKKSREAEVAALEVRLLDPEDPYRAADYAYDDNDAMGRGTDDVE
jgi:hypothetical protein